jgi:hypothetical protein
MKKKFKVGDRVIGNIHANEQYLVTKQGWIGIVSRMNKFTISVRSEEMSESESMAVNPWCFDLYEEFPQDAETVETYIIRSMKTMFKKHEKV